MKKFTKVLSVILAVVLCSFCLFACDEEKTEDETTTVTTGEGAPEEPVIKGEEVKDQVTRENILVKVNERMSTFKSLTAKIDMDMSIQMMGMTMTSEMAIKTMTDSEAGRAYTETDMTVMGETTKAVVYFDKDIYYMEAAGEKMYADMTVDRLSELLDQENAGVAELSFDHFESATLYSSEDGYLLIIDGLKPEGGALIGSAMESATEGYEIDLSKVKMEFTIDKEFTVTQMKMSLDMTMNMDEAMGDDAEVEIGDITATVDAVCTYSDLGTAGAKIQKPDLAGATKFDLDEMLGGEVEEDQL